MENEQLSGGQAGGQSGSSLDGEARHDFAKDGYTPTSGTGTLAESNGGAGRGSLVPQTGKINKMQTCIRCGHWAGKRRKVFGKGHVAEVCLFPGCLCGFPAAYLQKVVR